MNQIHNLTEIDIDFMSCIQRHSGDEIVFYKEVSGIPIPLTFYYPQDYDSKRKYPVFVFIHGGGWNSHKIFSNQKEWQGDYLGYLARYYADKGYVSVSIDYRLMQEKGQKEQFQLIDLYEDCEDAVTFLVTNSEKYGLDFTRSVVLGESAGGYLAAAIATFTYRHKPVFQRAILVNAITDLFDSQWNEYIPGMSSHPLLLEQSNIEKTYMLSPLHQICDATPQTLLIHGTEDSVVRPRHSQSFYDEMMYRHKLCELHWIEKTVHAFLLAEYMMEQNKPLMATKIGVDIINRWLNLNCGNE